MKKNKTSILNSKEINVLRKQILIVGGGAAGLNAALNLKNNEKVLVEKNGSNSLFSPWNLMVKPEKQLKKEMLITGNKINDLKLLGEFLKNYKKIIKDLKKIGIKFKKSNIGLIPDYPFPGPEVRKIFLNKIKNQNQNIEFFKGTVENFLIDKDRKIRGVVVSLFKSKKKIKIFFNYLILAAGGLGGFFSLTTGSKDSDGSILSLCCEAGLKMRDLEFFMFHPFLITDKRLSKVLISGDILTKMEYEDAKGKKFLSKQVEIALKTNQHHYIFSQMTKEFYLQSLKSKIFGRLICSDEWFEKFKRENEFGFVFKNFRKSEIKKIEIHPAFHYSIGGLTIDKNGQTSQKNVYAAGEITGGLHGSNRIGGLAILEALIFSKRAALNINKKIAKEKKEVLIPNKINKIGNLKLSKLTKEKVWEVLGPIKEISKLKKLKSFLEDKKILTSQEKLLKKITEICLLKKESVGTFLRKDIPFN